MVREQVKLSFSVLYGITIQGIRIRIGRSIVTLLGVVCGIAFLMSMLAGIVVKKGIHTEEEIRASVNRLYNVLIAETGTPSGRIYGIVVSGKLDMVEKRLIKRLSDEGASELRCYAKEPSGAVDETRKTALDKIGRDASAVIVAGDGPDISAPWNVVLSGARQKVIAFARKRTDSQLQSDSLLSGATIVSLEKNRKGDEVLKAAKEKQKELFRNIWILLISLCVTIIGIINSMLMAVTERFREIGTMKCLGALSSFIRRLFLIESSLIGLIGSAIGAIAGVLFTFTVYGFTYGFGLVVSSVNLLTVFIYIAISVVAGAAFSVVAAIYPAHFASKMVPATALRSNV